MSLALEDGLHRPVGTIAHPAVHASPFGLPAGALAEPHALHASEHHHTSPHHDASIALVERVDPDPIAPERLALRQWLDYHRATLVMKASGVNDEGARRTVTPGGLTLLGLVRHLTDVERYWFDWFF